MATDVAVPTWQQMEAEVLECKAETIEAALIGVRRLDGMFPTTEHKAMVTSFINVMQLEADNLHNAAQKLRSE